MITTMMRLVPPALQVHRSAGKSPKSHQARTWAQQPTATCTCTPSLDPSRTRDTSEVNAGAWLETARTMRRQQGQRALAHEHRLAVDISGPDPLPLPRLRLARVAPSAGFQEGLGQQPPPVAVMVATASA